MNAAGLLQHYERVADSPDAVAKLRRFVLDLAVRGKLVRQELTDGSASKVPSISGTKKPSNALPLDQGKTWSIPNSWDFVPLQELAAPDGLFTDGDWVESKDQDPAGSVRLTQLADVGVGEFRDRSERFMNSSTAARLNCTFLAPGDILIARMPDPLGRACMFPGDSKPCVTVVDVAVLRLGNRHFNGAFVVLAINSAQFARNVASFAVGTTRSRISRGNLSQLPFPVPPLAEQHRIVAKVDELMALCDQLEAARAGREARRDRLAAASLAHLNAPDTETFHDDVRFALDALAALTARPDQIKQLRQTILNLAVRGRLLPQEAGDIPPALSASSALSLPDGIPATWCYSCLEHLLAEDTRNGYSRRPDDAEGGTPILRISAGTARADGIVAEEEHKLISGIDSAARVQFGLKVGDLLACRFNGNKNFVGRLTVFRDYLGIQPIFPDKLIRVRIAPQLASPEYVRIAGESDIVRSDVEAACATTVGNWGISAGNLKAVRFPVPPIAEQHRIVAKVDELMALCDLLEASLGTGDATRSKLLDALLQNALEPTVEMIEAV